MHNIDAILKLCDNVKDSNDEDETRLAIREACVLMRASARRCKCPCCLGILPPLRRAIIGCDAGNAGEATAALFDMFSVVAEHYTAAFGVPMAFNEQGSNPYLN
jgi:hypothetical protein